MPSATESKPISWIDHVEQGRNHEALTSVRMALKCIKTGKLDKTQKLFHHAFFLNPNHHDILFHYGEFLESIKDIIHADHYYLRAIISRQENSPALENRARTLPIVTQLDKEELNMIDNKRLKLVSLNKEDSNLLLLKKLYFEHIHHTVAIEGNTMSLAETRSVVETRQAVPGKSTIEFHEILGLVSALQYVNETLTNKHEDITIADILEIHRKVMGYVDPSIAGIFRTTPVFVGGHTPPPASDVEVLMDEFVASLQTPDVRKMHPIHIAAYAHHKLVFIHPFLDGNGRTARLLMNLLISRFGYPSIIIRKEEKSYYYEVLMNAHNGDIRPFHRFIAHCTDDAIDSEFMNYGIGCKELNAPKSLYKKMHFL